MRFLSEIEGSCEVLSRESGLRLIEEALNRLVGFLLIGRESTRVDRLEVLLRTLNPLVRLIHQPPFLVLADLGREARWRLRSLRSG